MGQGVPGLGTVKPPPGVICRSRTRWRGQICRCAAARAQKTRLILWRGQGALNSTKLVSLTLARVGCVGGRRLSRPPAVVLRLPWASIIPMALGAATSGAQSTQ